MKFTHMIRGSAPLIIAIAVVILAIIYFSIWIFGACQLKENPNDRKVIENMTAEKLPDDVLEGIMLHQKFAVIKWEYDYENKQFIIYAIRRGNQYNVSDLQGKQIGNWTIKIIHDVDYENETDLVLADLKELKKNPDLQLGEYDIGDKEINIWVPNLTSENRALEGKVIRGRMVHIWQNLHPPSTVITKM
jgi:hypothetical protein